MKISISEAARRADVNRKTIQRKLGEGRISKEIGDDGEPLIDLSELARLYPAVLSPAHGRACDIGHHRAGGDAPLHAECSMLRERCASLTRERNVLVADKEDLRAERDRWRTQAERLLLTQQPAKPSKGFWGWLLGR